MALSKADRLKLKGVHADLVAVLEKAAAVSPVPFRVTEGLRSRARQAELVKAGFSKTMNSRHLTGHAADIVPLLDVNKDGKINAVDMYDWGAIRKLAPFIKKAAKSLGVPIEWGGDWQSFPDGPHWQLPRSYK
jgi:peptidoglycan L-alanyl-D-glutamate endopeptidase CwlK